MARKADEPRYMVRDVGAKDPARTGQMLWVVYDLDNKEFLEGETKDIRQASRAAEEANKNA